MSSGAGGWDDEPPYHHPVFVLTHYPHAPIAMLDGTTFHFVTDGIPAALERAFAAAGGRDVRLGGGASAVQQYMRAGLVDELHLAIAPVLLGSDERLFDHLDDGWRQYRYVEVIGVPGATHVRLERSVPKTA